jgi:cytidine deaminase
MNDKDLLALALMAREKAYAPYSGFKVGAALVTAQDRVFTGCNIENSSYGLTICAERVALAKAVSEGEHEFSRILVAGGTEPTMPCGACLQFLREFAPDITVICASAKGETESYKLAELLPHAFRLS